MLLATVFGCGRQGLAPNHKRDFNQGKSTWVSAPQSGTSAPQRAQTSPPPKLSRSSPQPAQKAPLKTAPPKTRVNLSKVAQDLDLITPPPGYEFVQPRTEVPVESPAASAPITPNAQTVTPSQVYNSDIKRIEVTGAPTIAQTSEAEIKSHLEDLYLSLKPYDPQLAKAWIDKLQEIDTKVTETLTYGSNRQVTLRDESQAFVKVLKAMLTKNGTSRTPLTDEEGMPLAEYDIEIGGDILPVLEDMDFKDSIGRPCDKVLCVLASIHKPAPNAIAFERGIKPMDAAYDIMFIYFQYRYIISLQVPKERFKSDDGKLLTEAYAEAKKNYVPFSTDMIRAIARALWMLPPTFHKMGSLLTFHNVDPHDFDSGLNWITERFDSHTIGLYLHGEIKETSVEFGSIAFDQKRSIKLTQVPIINVFRINPEDNDYVCQKNQTGNCIVDEEGNNVNITYDRAFTATELSMFKPDYYDSVIWDSIGVVVHELSHAYDLSEVISNEQLVSQNLPEFGKGGINFPGHVSYSASWLRLSGWKYKGLQDVDLRTIPNSQIELRTEIPEGDTQNRPYRVLPRLVKGFYNIRNKTYDDFLASDLWSVSPSSLFYWSYALTNPQEDFAVAVQGYVTEPSAMKSTNSTGQPIPNEKYSFLAENLFAFEVDGQDLTWSYKRPTFISDLSTEEVNNLRLQQGQQYYDFSRYELRDSPLYTLRRRDDLRVTPTAQQPPANPFASKLRLPPPAVRQVEVQGTQRPTDSKAGIYVEIVNGVSVIRNRQ